VASTDLHCYDDEFTDYGEATGEGGVEIRVSQRKPDGSVGGDHFEETGEGGECLLQVLASPGINDRAHSTTYIFGGVLDVASFRYSDNKEA
jgi:hypothetical protein